MWPELAEGVGVNIGAGEYGRVAAGASRRAVEQVLLLAVEICFASLEEGEAQLFAEYAGNVADSLANDVGGRLPRDLKTRLNSLSGRAKQLGRSSPGWWDAIEELKHL